MGLGQERVTPPPTPHLTCSGYLGYLRGWDVGDEECTRNYQSSARGLGTVISSHMPHITLPMAPGGGMEESAGGGITLLPAVPPRPPPAPPRFQGKSQSVRLINAHVHFRRRT